jgi:hypothetical protein
MVKVRYYIGGPREDTLTAEYPNRTVADRAIVRLAEMFGWYGIIVLEG